MAIIDCSARNPRYTSTGVDRGIDIDVAVRIPGALSGGARWLTGTVTLLPAEDGRPVYASWGEPDHWIDGRLLAQLRDLPAAEYRAALDEIKHAASAAAGRP